MTDYLRKAVELADGWRYKDGYIIVGERYYITINKKAFPVETTIGLDALAAQLVRQVDALDQFFVDSDRWGTVKVWAQNSGLGMGRIAKEKETARTMNTIKAIVDSGVLK
jgi:hypothetical protein